MKDYFYRIVNRLANEPALGVGLVIAVANLLGVEGQETADFVESGLVLLGSILVRQKVTPVRKLARDFGEGEV